jgi:hypothetical protein
MMEAGSPDARAVTGDPDLAVGTGAPAIAGVPIALSLQERVAQMRAAARSAGIASGDVLGVLTTALMEVMEELGRLMAGMPQHFDRAAAKVDAAADAYHRATIKQEQAAAKAIKTVELQVQKLEGETVARFAGAITDALKSKLKIQSQWYSRQAFATVVLMISFALLVSGVGGFWWGLLREHSRYEAVSEQLQAAFQNTTPSGGARWAELMRFNNIEEMMHQCRARLMMDERSGRHVCSMPVWLDPEPRRETAR